MVFGINGALNAGILAAQILATDNEALFAKTVQYKETLIATFLSPGLKIFDAQIRTIKKAAPKGMYPGMFSRVMH